MSVIGQRIKQSAEPCLIFNQRKLDEWKQSRELAGTETKPPMSILNPEFEYRHSWNTNLRETWRKAREEQRKAMVIHREFNNVKN